MYSVLLLVVWFVMQCGSVLILEQYFAPRFGRIPAYIGYPGVYIVFSLISFYLDKTMGADSLTIKGLLGLGGMLLATCVFFKGSFIKRLGVYILILSVQMVLNMICGGVYVWLVQPSSLVPMMNGDSAGSKTRLLLAAIHTVLFVGQAVVFAFIKRWRKKNSPTFSVYTVMLLLSQVLMLAACMITLSFTNRTFILSTQIGAMVIFIIGDVLVFRITAKEAKMREAQERLNYLELLYSERQKSYQEMQIKKEELAKLRHDMANQLMTVHSLLQHQQVQQAQHQLMELATALSNTQLHHYSDNLVADAVLSHAAARCEKSSIAFSCEVRLPAVLPFSEVHLCSLFSNLLDNACAATAMLLPEQREVTMQASFTKGILWVRVENSWEPTRPPQGGTGYGRLILRDLANQYQGNWQEEITDTRYSVTMTLLKPENAERSPQKNL